MSDASHLKDLLAQLQRAGKLPAGLSQSQLGQLERAFAKWQGQVADGLVEKIMAEWQDKIKAAQTLGEPASARGIIYDLTKFVGSEEIADKIRFALKISQEVASGAGQYLNQNLSPEALDEYPALEFTRLFDRDLPRGEKRGPKGTIVEDPDDAWPARWAAAGEAIEDADDWLPWEGDAQTGRGVALKSSRIWQALGDGEGGYTDTLGNPFPPFAFNSGFRTFDVNRAEAEELGLLDKDEPAEPAKIDFAKLFGSM